MPQLVIDEGNTLVKVAVFNQDELVETAHYPNLDVAVLNQLIDRYAVSKAILSSVRKKQPDGQQPDTAIPLITFTRQMATNIRNHYGTPDTLGLDRLAAVMGARYLYPDADNLVIDAGTCITYDGVDHQGQYFGGSIAPGLRMRYQALHQYTAALPLATASPEFNQPYGTDTLSAMQSGVQNGIKYEASGFISSYLTGTNRLNVILTGGDGDFLHTLLKNSIFAGYIKTEPYLVLKGLNAAITKHND